MKFRNPKIGDFIKLPSREIGLLRRFADDGEFGVVRCYSQEFDNTWVASYTREYLKRNRIKPQDVPNDIWEKFALPTPATDFLGKDRTLDNQLAAAEHSLNKYRLMGKKRRPGYCGSNHCSLCMLNTKDEHQDCSNCPLTLSGHIRCGQPGSIHLDMFGDDKTKPMIKCLEKTVTWLKQEIAGQEESKKVDSDIRYEVGGGGEIYKQRNHGTDYAIQGRSFKSREEADDFVKLEALTTRFKARIAELNGDEYKSFNYNRTNFYLDINHNSGNILIANAPYFQPVPDSLLLKSFEIAEQLRGEFSKNEIKSVIRQKWCES